MFLSSRYANRTPITLQPDKKTNKMRLLKKAGKNFHIEYKNGQKVTVIDTVADDNPDNEVEACQRALAAAQASNQALLDRGSEFDHGIGLHVGSFQFGNIGSLRRLDFTVIGNEVNVAARIEAKCSVLRQRLLMSEAFVDQAGMPARLVERVPLKGIEGDFALYAPMEQRPPA